MGVSLGRSEPEVLLAEAKYDHTYRRVFAGTVTISCPERNAQTPPDDCQVLVASGVNVVTFVRSVEEEASHHWLWFQASARPRSASPMRDTIQVPGVRSIYFWVYEYPVGQETAVAGATPIILSPTADCDA